MNSFVHDRTTGVTELVSVRADTGEAPGNSLQYAITPDARFIALEANTSYVPEDTSNRRDVYVAERSEVTPPVQPPDLSLIKSNDADQDGVFTDTETTSEIPATVTYQIQVTNRSPDTAVIDSVSDDTHGTSGSSCRTDGSAL